MEIRELRWEDFGPLVENYLAVYDEVGTDPDIGIPLFETRPTLGEEAVWFAELFRETQSGRTLAGVAVEEGRAVGLCTVAPRSAHREVQHRGVLGILIAKGSRGRGIGRALLEFVIERARGRYEFVDLTVFASNLRARRLYESLGFRSWGMLPHGVRRNGRYTDVEHMALDLRPDAGRAPSTPSRVR